ncbi:MAG: helix-turn-helix transcriptional regulator [Cyclobacteriaceae bacterium]|nr:helix-turn-helix transcriptional regulator [Cyclobacteriaceae bacterium]MCK5276902.1 helix-turn-helix transcriptional regulator [Cyclobacteriaceae bacterium]MCK5368658.1 helix-turn-helix transcriptional regulator [Cyclobacteriaceae bacterium]MCK5470729.1 helix-turn-helix transcriptional regulator [Cyclobacteriaceae bacterium]
MTTIITIGFIQAFFFTILALTKKNKEVTDYILAFLFLTLCYQLGVNYVMLSDYKYQFPHLIGTSGPLSLMYGPLLFFFIKNYISEKHIFKPKYLLHFLPFIANHTYNFVYFYFQTGGQKIKDFEEIIAGKPDFDISIFLILRSLSPLIYCIWSIYVLKVHRKNLKKLYSFTSDKLKLEWLWYLTWSMFIVGASALILNLIIVFFDVADWVQLRKMILVIATFWVFFLGYYSIKKTPFYRSFHIDGLDTLELDYVMKQPEKYEKTRLKAEEVPGLKKKLLDYLEESKPYLNKNLTIGELADSIEVPAYQLSQLINDQLDKSFFELINSYRVQEVKLRFFEPKYRNLTLLGIAMECGFNSKASFHRIFKQLTNQTPTEYIKTKKAA